MNGQAPHYFRPLLQGKYANYSILYLSNPTEVLPKLKMTHSFDELCNYNFKSLLDHTKLDLARWSAVTISLAGRIGFVKMAVLPHFLYLF